MKHQKNLALNHPRKIKTFVESCKKYSVFSDTKTSHPHKWHKVLKRCWGQVAVDLLGLMPSSQHIEVVQQLASHYILIISQLWLTSHTRSTVVLLDTGTPGTSREIFSEDAGGETQTGNPSVINRVL